MEHKSEPLYQTPPRWIALFFTNRSCDSRPHSKTSLVTGYSLRGSNWFFCGSCIKDEIEFGSVCFCGTISSWESNAGYAWRRRALSSLRHPCFTKINPCVTTKGYKRQYGRLQISNLNSGSVRNNRSFVFEVDKSVKAPPSRPVHELVKCFHVPVLECCNTIHKICVVFFLSITKFSEPTSKQLCGNKERDFRTQMVIDFCYCELAATVKLNSRHERTVARNVRAATT